MEQVNTTIPAKPRQRILFALVSHTSTWNGEYRNDELAKLLKDGYRISSVAQSQAYAPGASLDIRLTFVLDLIEDNKLTTEITQD